MADKKISQLTGASTPLAGTEVLPIVQSGSTVKVASDDLTVKNVRSNATTGILQVTGPAAATTRVMTVPNSDFTVATTGANTFSGLQTVAAAFNGVQAEFGFTSGRGLQIATGLSSGTNEANSILNARGAGAGQLEFQLDGTPRFTMELGGNLIVNTAGKGIDFSANTGAAGMTSELLDWYEEGIATVTLAFGGGSTGIAYSKQELRYTRIGNRVMFQCAVALSNKGSSSGAAVISGLPWASKNQGYGAHGLSTVALNLTGLTGAVIAYIPENSSTIALTQSDAQGNGTNIADTEFTNTAYLMISGQYEVG